MHDADPGPVKSTPAAALSVTSADIAAVFLAAMILIWPAALNRYPLVYPDTGNYLGQALKGYVGWNAPPFYSFFLLATDLRLTLWLPIFVQAIIAAHLVFLMMREFGLARWQWFLLACLLLSLLTGLPWFITFVMPYVFAGFLVLSLWLIGFGRTGPWERRYLFVLALGSASVHFSHPPLAAGIAIVGGVLAGAYLGARAGWRVFARMALVPVLAILLFMTVSIVAHHRLSPAPYGSVLVAGRMLYDGTARDYLYVACPTQHYRICPYLDTLPENRDDFLFNWPPMWTALGGAEGWAPEASKIVHATIRYEPGAVALAALSNSARLFRQLYLHDSLQPWPLATGPGPLLATYFPHQEFLAYQRSGQSAGRLRKQAAWFGPLQTAVAWIGLVALICSLPLNWRDCRSVTLSMVVLAALVGNALITGGLSGVQDHYEARIAWLMSFTPALILVRRFAGLHNVPAAAHPASRWLP
jgi:hypothetical protein